MKILEYLLLFFKGMITGIANVIPGVSGGTMAFILGIYDRLTDSIGNFFFEIRDWAKTRPRLFFLAFFGSGSVVSYWAFANLLSRLLSHDLSKQFTVVFFIGLIIGSIPYIVKMHNDMKIKPRRILLFLIAFAGVVAISLASEGLRASSVPPAGGDVEITPLYGAWLFLTGILSAGSMVLPGFSGSALLISLGEYYNMIHYSADFINGLGAGEIHRNALLYVACISAGTPVGAIFISKIINKVLHAFPSESNFFILGLLIASIYQLYSEIADIFTFKSSAVLISILCLAAGFIAAFGLSKIRKT